MQNALNLAASTPAECSATVSLLKKGPANIPSEL
jgi:hypothetical protein